MNLATRRYIGMMTDMTLLQASYGVPLRQAIGMALADALDDQSSISARAMIDLARGQGSRLEDWTAATAGAVARYRPGVGVGSEVPIAEYHDALMYDAVDEKGEEIGGLDHE